MTCEGRSKRGESILRRPGTRDSIPLRARYARRVTRRFGWALGGIVLAAAALRLFRLDHFSYGLDEILQGYMIQGDWKSFWGSLKFDAVHPPLDYLIARGVEAFGPPDWGRKLPAVLWGVGTVAVLGGLITRRVGRAAGLTAAAFLAFAPFHVRYSQEFRPYSLGLFLMCLSLLALDAFLARPATLRLAALFLACLATAYALYLAAFALAIAAAALLVEDAFDRDTERRRAARRFLLWSPAFVAALWVAYLPWWPVAVEAARRAPPVSAEPLTGQRIGRTLSFFAFAPADGEPIRRGTILFWALVAIGTWLAARRSRHRFLLAWAALALTGIEILGQLHPHWYSTRRFLPAGLAIVALAGLSIGELLRRPVARLAAASVLVVIIVLDLRSLTRYFRDGRADWRTLADFLRREAPPAERIFTENQYSELCVAFYLEGPLWLRTGGHLGRDIWNLEGQIVRLTWSWHAGKTAWLVLAGEPRHEPLRRWAAAFPCRPFPSAEGALLCRLDPALREKALGPGR